MLFSLMVIKTLEAECSTDPVVRTDPRVVVVTHAEQMPNSEQLWSTTSASSSVVIPEIVDLLRLDPRDCGPTHNLVLQDHFWSCEPKSVNQTRTRLKHRITRTSVTILFFAIFIRTPKVSHFDQIRYPLRCTLCLRCQ